MSQAKQYYTCPRCSGTGHLRHFSHIDSGICFLCSGKKVVDAKTFNHETREHSPLMQRRINWITFTSSKDFAKLPFEKMEAIREFVHNLPPALSYLYDFWMDKFEEVFQDAQSVVYFDKPNS